MLIDDSEEVGNEEHERLVEKAGSEGVKLNFEQAGGPGQEQ